MIDADLTLVTQACGACGYFWGTEVVVRALLLTPCPSCGDTLSKREVQAISVPESVVQVRRGRPRKIRHFLSERLSVDADDRH